MENNAWSEPRQISSNSQRQRRRFLQSALAITAGAGFQPLASVDALAAERSPDAARKASAAHPIGMASSMSAAIKACLDCHSMCLQTMSYCLERGGRHVESQHFRTMLDCAELCQTSANFMQRESSMHGRVCGVCAEACEACAQSCERVGDMRACIDECQRCAKSCRSMS